MHTPYTILAILEHLTPADRRAADEQLGRFFAGTSRRRRRLTAPIRDWWCRLRSPRPHITESRR